jgi:hypothetical protein
MVSVDRPSRDSIPLSFSPHNCGRCSRADRRRYSCWYRPHRWPGSGRGYPHTRLYCVHSPYLTNQTPFKYRKFLAKEYGQFIRNSGSQQHCTPKLIAQQVNVNKNYSFTFPCVLWIRFRKNPKLIVGSGYGFGTRDFGSRSGSGTGIGIGC